MGGYPIATASTPGFTTFRGKVACVCLAAWLPVLEDLAQIRELIDGPLDIVQLTGNATASAGVHAQGGAFDLRYTSDSMTLLIREMGAPYWPRFWTGNVHGHGVLNGCPHNAPARYQISEYLRGEDGLTGDGRDTYPRPSTLRTWSQGIAWAEGQIMSALDYITDQLKALSEQATANDRKNQLRANAIAKAIAADDAEKDALLAKLLAAVDKVDEAVVAALPKAEPQPEPVPALGIDVSRYQTIEQSAAALTGKPDFCIINASTGLRSVSSALASHTAVSREHADVTGFYHWTQTINELATTPDRSDPVGEAQHFLRTIEPLVQVGDILAMDHEKDTTPDPMSEADRWRKRVAYAVAWLPYVAAAKHCTPLAYLNWNWIVNLREHATLEQWDVLCDFPVWLAQPGSPGEHDTIDPKPGSTRSPRILLHQYATVDGVLRDYCHDLNALRALAVKE